MRKAQRLRTTRHQQRVLAAILKMEEVHGWSWWTRDAIGHVVDAGGFHGVIQLATISRLKGLGLIQAERGSWPVHIQRRIRCSCACSDWGLTANGRELALTLNIRWPEAAAERIAAAKYSKPFHYRDEDDDGPDEPKASTPSNQPSLCLA